MCILVSGRQSSPFQSTGSTPETIQMQSRLRQDHNGLDTKTTLENYNTSLRSNILGWDVKNWERETFALSGSTFCLMYMWDLFYDIIFILWGWLLPLVAWYMFRKSKKVKKLVRKNVPFATAITALKILYLWTACYSSTSSVEIPSTI